MSGALLLKVIIIIRVESGLAGLDADNARRQLACDFLQVGRRGGSTSVARREYIEVTVVGCPDSLVILRTVASASKADRIGFYYNRSIVEAVSAVNSYESLVWILGRRDLSGCVTSRALSTVLGCYECLVRDLFREGVHTIVAHAHRNYGCIKFAVGFHETGKADNLAVAEEVLCNTLTGCRVAGMDIQVVELQIFGIITLGIFFLRAVIGGRGNDVVAPCAVCRYTVERIFTCFFYFSGCGVQDIRGSGARISVIVLQSEKIVLSVK